MRNLTSGVFEHLMITFPMEVNQRVLNKYKTVLLECKQLAKDLAGDKWTLGDLEALSNEYFSTWAKSGGLTCDGYAYLGMDK